MADHQCIKDEQVRVMDQERPIVQVTTRGPMMAVDPNRARKNYSKYASTSREVLFNMLAVKIAKTRQVLIMWTEEDEEEILYPHEDALIIKANVANRELGRILGIQKV